MVYRWIALAATIMQVGGCAYTVYVGDATDEDSSVIRQHPGTEIVAIDGVPRPRSWTWRWLVSPGKHVVDAYRSGRNTATVTTEISAACRLEFDATERGEYWIASWMVSPEWNATRDTRRGTMACGVFRDTGPPSPGGMMGCYANDLKFSFERCRAIPASISTAPIPARPIW